MTPRTVLVAGYAVPDAVKFVFLGPLVGAAARVLFAPLTDRTAARSGPWSPASA